MLFFYGLAALLSYKIGPLCWSASIMALGAHFFLEGPKTLVDSNRNSQEPGIILSEAPM